MSNCQCFSNNIPCCSCPPKTLKLEVGKKYIDNLGESWKVHVKTSVGFICEFRWNKGRGMLAWFSDDGKSIKTDISRYLVSEYKEPRKQETSVYLYDLTGTLVISLYPLGYGQYLGKKTVTVIEGEGM